MKPRKSRDAALMLVGLVCLAAYILACMPARPAFSPDGSRILFTYWDKKTESSSVITFNRTAQEAETLFIWKGKPLSAQWTPDGQRAILAWVDSEETRKVMILPAGRKTPTRFFDLPIGKSEDSGLFYFFPPPVVGNHLFLAEGHSVYRLNLDTEDTKTLDFGEDGTPVLNRHRNQVYFFTGSKREGVFEIGRIDTENLAPIPILQIETKEPGELSPFLAISEDGSRFAIVSTIPSESSTNKQHQILIYHGKDLERAIPLDSEADPIAPGNTEWSQDGTTLYAAYARRVEADGGYEVGVLEVPLTGASVRQIPLTRLTERPDDLLWEFQIARSPDGTTIAGACPRTDLIKGTDCALYLVDLARPDRKVTKIPLPLPPAPTKPIPEGG